MSQKNIKKYSLNNEAEGNISNNDLINLKNSCSRNIKSLTKVLLALFRR